MGDAENILPSSKKRAAGREITKDNPGLDDEGDSSEETGTFKKASDEVLATRRIVKVRRNQSSTATSSNPFAGIRLVAPTEPTPPAAPSTEVVNSAEKAQEDKISDSSEVAEKSQDETAELAEAKIEEPGETEVEKEISENKQNDIVGPEAAESKAVDEKPLGDNKTDNEKTLASEVSESINATESDKVEIEAKKDDGSEEIDPRAESNSLSSFQQLSTTRNAFTGLAGTGFSTTTFSFGSGSTNGSRSSFGFGLSTNGSSPIFNTTGPSIVPKNEGTLFPSIPEVPVETGEENEKAVFTADSVLFEYNNGGWKERGKGELKVNVSTSGPERARLLMRSRGNYRLILNASLYPDMKLANMEKRGITFACVNSVGESKDGLSTLALKFKDSVVVEEFRAAVTAHKDKTATSTSTTADLKTPENSPQETGE